MSVLEKIVVPLQAGVRLLASAGSLMVYHDPETNKDSINVVPAVVWVYSLSLVGCVLSEGEPFSTCVRSILTTLGG